MNKLAASMSIMCLVSATFAAPPAPPTSSTQIDPMAQQLHYSLDTACESATQDDSLVLVVFFSITDINSAQLSQQVVWNRQVRQQVGVLHTFEIDINLGFEAGRQFELQQVPTLVLMTPQRKIVARHDGPLDAAAFLEWIKTGRQRVADGVWLGLPLRANDNRRQQNYISDAIEQLKNRDPEVRRRGKGILIDSREAAVEPLIKTLDDEYLGSRIAAYETLKEMAPHVPEYEPWLQQVSRNEQAVAIQQWWSTEGRLPVETQVRKLSAVELRTLSDTIENVFYGSPVRRTRAMTNLVDTGSAALPAIRQAILRAEREDDLDAVLLFEDIRWAILVPDAVESAKSVRHDLARGTSEKRQAAVKRLGGAGVDALPALRELIDDGDSLVRESAIHALSEVGGQGALAATATMLEAQDPNLRMIAAQELGGSGSPEAGKYLTKAIDDTDEVVAIAAIAAMEQAKATSQSGALIKALDDPRWRVRAAAAECLGKLEVSKAKPHLEDLLSDEDPFVVKAALTALQEIGVKPDAEKLYDLVTRYEAMRPIVIEFLLDDGDAAAIGHLIELYRNSDDAQKQQILSLIAAKNTYHRSDDAQYRPLINDAIASENPAIRRIVVSVLKARAYPLAIEYVEKLLADTDDQVRSAATGLVIPLVAFHYGLTDYGRDLAGYGELADNSQLQSLGSGPALIPSVQGDMMGGGYGYGGTLPEKAVSNTDDDSKQKKTLQLHQTWHKLLSENPPKEENISYRFALFITASGQDRIDLLPDLPGMEQLLKDNSETNSDVIARLLLTCTPMPEGEKLVHDLFNQPDVYGLFLAQRARMNPELKKVLLAPERMLLALEVIPDNQRDDLVYSLVGRYSEPGVISSLDTEQAKIFVQQLTNSEKPLPRAVGFFLAATRQDLLNSDQIIAGLADADQWVRRAAVQAYIASDPSMDEIESTIGPMIADASYEVAAVAASTILTQPLRDAAELPPPDAYFKYESTSVSRSWSRNRQSRPPGVIEREPVFLPALQQLSTRRADDEESANIIALTLAQYGDFTALHKRLETWEAGSRQQVPGILLVGLALTNDDRYLEPLRVRVQQSTSSYDLREQLQWLRGTRSDEARELRREINKRMRELN